MRAVIVVPVSTDPSGAAAQAVGYLIGFAVILFAFAVWIIRIRFVDGGLRPAGYVIAAASGAGGLALVWFALFVVWPLV
jgi:hypothetical protein